VAEAGNVWGCYLHGLFANESLRRAWLASLGWRGEPQYASASLHLQTVLDTVASHVEASLDMQRLEAIIWERSRQS
jgi:adenosylcobyric acid synthase